LLAVKALLCDANRASTPEPAWLTVATAWACVARRPTHDITTTPAKAE
jgi:hypothetical protein